MEFTFICPACFQEINADSDMTGQAASCPTCDTSLTVPSPTDPPQARLGGYVLERSLGEGRMGIVYLANQVTMNRKVALKILSPELTEDEEYVRRFVEETRLNAQIEHPNVVKVFDVGIEEDSGRVYAAMSLIEGESLARRLEEHGPLPEKDVLAHGLTVAKTLKYVFEHHQLRHQNLTPNHIFIDRHGEVKLTNLGVTRHRGEAPDPNASSTATAMLYMSPEQALGQGQDVRADIYSLGVSLYQLLTGKVPFADGSTEAPPVTSVRPDVSDECEALVAVMLEREAANRHGDWSELIGDFERVLAGKQPLRSPGGKVTTEEELKAETRARLRRRGHGDEPAPASEAATGAETDAAAEAAATATVAEVRAEGVTAETAVGETAQPEEGAKARKPSLPRTLAKIVGAIVVLLLAFKYGFGPLITAARQASGKEQTESTVYVLNNSETPYKLTLGWRRLKRELRPNSVQYFKLFVGMSETQGLKAVAMDGSGKHKVKVPLKPGCFILVNLKNGKTFNIYDPDKVKGLSVGGVELLADQILGQKAPDATWQILQDAKAVAKQAVVGTLDDEVIDLTEYRPLMAMVGVGYGDLAQDATKHVLTDQPYRFPIAGGTIITWDANAPKNVAADLAVGKDGKLTLSAVKQTVEIAKTLRLTLEEKDERLSVVLRTANHTWKPAATAYQSQWAYSATKPAKQEWDWNWTFGATVQVDQTKQMRFNARVPKTGKETVKEDEIKLNR